MWSSSEEPLGTTEADPPDSAVDLKDAQEQSKTQVDSKLDSNSRFKTRAKKLRSDKNNEMSSSESTSMSIPDSSTVESADDVDDISQAKTPKAKSSLLQKKLAEDRKIFQQRSQRLTENKRVVEEKVKALRLQLEEKYVAPVSVVSPVSVTQIPHLTTELSHTQDKDNKIAELSNKILDLEALVIDLQDNLKEKDSVIDSKTKAITLMSADLSIKGKTVLDNLEDTKDEMRSMQENFILVETSLRSKNDNLLKQLEEKTQQLSTLEENVQSLTDKLEIQKQAETVNADFSRSTMDTLVDTKDAMKSMQENFILIESSLKSKNEHLLKQLEEREIKLAEADAKILNLETGMGIERQPNVEELLYKVEKLEESNRNLQDEKYELQKQNANLQDKIISNEFACDNNLLVEKDNRIVELEGLIKELKISTETLEEYKINAEKEIVDLNKKNEEKSMKITDFENQILNLENEKSELVKLTIIEKEIPKEDEKDEKDEKDKKVQILIKELDELNKSMIKMKVEHKNKLKNMRKQLNNFKKISDTHAEIVKLENQVTLLEEEKGNLQLSLVDFDELKASTNDWQERIDDLEGKVSAQAKEIQTHIEAIATLENQKLDLIQEIHAAKQEVSSLEAEISESENLRVTAEMKVVDLEEELESSQRQTSTEPLDDTDRADLQRQIETLLQDNERLTQKIGKLEELKSLSEVGSTDSFVKTGSNVDSTESFEALAADADKAELIKRVDGLTREIGTLTEKLARYEEKGSSDAGSTESFERIPEGGEEAATKLESLARENYELAAQVKSLEEKLNLAMTGERTEPNLETETESQQLQPAMKELPENASRLDSSPVVIAEGLAAEWESEELPKPIDATIEEPKATSVDREADLVADLRSRLDTKEAELRDAIAIRDKSRDELEVLDGQRKAAEENLAELNDKLYAYAEEQNQLIDRLAQKQTLVERLEAKLESESKLLMGRLEEEERRVAELLEAKNEREEARDLAERQLRELEARHEENLQHAANVSAELRQAYKSLELLKLKHTEDIKMLNRRLEDVIEEFQACSQENANLGTELREKNEVLEKSVLEEAKLNSRLNDMEKKAEMQLDKLKRYVAVAKKKTVQCEELEDKLAELEDKFIMEKNEKEARNTELRESLANITSKDNRIEHMKEELQSAQIARDEVLRELEAVKLELVEAASKDNVIADMKEELQRSEASRKEALLVANEVRQKDVKIESMEQELESLRDSRDEALREYQLANEEVHRTMLILEDMRSQKADSDDYLQRLNEDRDEALKAVEVLRAELNQTRAKLDDAERTQEELQLVSKDRDEILRKFETNSYELGTKDELIANLENALHRYRTGQESCDELKRLQLALEEAVREVEEAKARSRETMEKDQTIAKLHEALKQQLQELDAELTEANDKIRELSAAKIEYEEQLQFAKSLRDENNALLWKQAELEEQLRIAETESKERLEHLETLKNQPCNDCSTKLRALEITIQERDITIDNQAKELRDKVTDYENRQGSLMDAYNELNGRYNALVSESERSKASRELTVDDSEESSHTNSLAEELKSERAKVVALMEESERLKSNRSKTKIEADESCARVAQLEDRIARILNERDGFRLRVNDIARTYNEQRESSENDIRYLSNQLEVSTLERNRIAKELEDIQRLNEAAPALIEFEAPPESMWDDLEFPAELNDKFLNSSAESDNIPIVPTIEPASGTVQETYGAPVSKYQEEIRELKANLDALASENEELQRMFEQKREIERVDIDELRASNARLTERYDKLSNDYDDLKRRYERSSEDADDQLQSMRRNYELTTEELALRKTAHESIVDDLNKMLERERLKYEEIRNRTQLLEVELERVNREFQSRSEVDREKEELRMSYATELRDRSEEVRSLREKVSDLEASLLEKEQLLASLESLIEGKETELRKRDEEVKRLRNAVTSDIDRSAVQETRKELNASKLERSSRVDENELPVFTFPGGDDERELQTLRSELAVKNDEIQRLQEWISNNSTTYIVQDMQDSINALYNEKSELEGRLAEKSNELEFLKAKERNRFRKRSLDEDRLVKIQGEFSRDMELLQLRRAADDKESELKAVLERSAGESFEKQRQLENLEFTVAELQREVAGLRALEGLVLEDRAIIDRLTSEKEQTQRDARETIERILKGKENEINELKLRFEDERSELIAATGLCELDLKNLKEWVEQRNLDKDFSLKDWMDHLLRLQYQLCESENRVGEVSSTKDTEIYKAKVELSEKNVRLKELIALTEEEKKQLTEMRRLLEVKETEITGLKEQLAEKSKEFKLMQQAIQRRVVVDAEEFARVTQRQELQHSPGVEVANKSTSNSSTTDELDLALYTLHQRDMRCEELTRELMQLLEERDTLQLRLSNTIRVNEDLRNFKITSSAFSAPKKNLSSTEKLAENSSLFVRNSSPSRFEDSIEIAKEAMNSSLSEDNKTLAQKLLQLKSVDQGRDVRLRDERELRHAQQMSLLAHRDVLNTLPSEAASRLVNANYTPSQEVQSQTNVLLNWLWGKSTSKIVHM